MTARADEAGTEADALGAGVVIDSVGKVFRRAGRRTVALAGVSLRVRPGELISLLGPSGCGQVHLAAHHRGRAARR